MQIGISTTGVLTGKHWGVLPVNGQLGSQRTEWMSGLIPSPLHSLPTSGPKCTKQGFERRYGYLISGRIKLLLLHKFWPSFNATWWSNTATVSFKAITNGIGAAQTASGVRTPVERLSLDRVAGCPDKLDKRSRGNWGWWESCMSADLYIKAWVKQIVREMLGWSCCERWKFWKLGQWTGNGWCYCWVAGVNTATA